MRGSRLVFISHQSSFVSESLPSLAQTTDSTNAHAHHTRLLDSSTQLTHSLNSPLPPSSTYIPLLSLHLRPYILLLQKQPSYNQQHQQIQQQPPVPATPPHPYSNSASSTQQTVSLRPIRLPPLDLRLTPSAPSPRFLASRHPSVKSKFVQLQLRTPAPVSPFALLRVALALALSLRPIIPFASLTPNPAIDVYTTHTYIHQQHQRSTIRTSFHQNPTQR